MSGRRALFRSPWFGDGMTSEAIEESGVNVFIFALALGSGAARRSLESSPTGANEPSGIGQLKPGRRTAIVRFQSRLHPLFLSDAVGAMRQPVVASHFRRVCAGRITAPPNAEPAGEKWCRRGARPPVRPAAKILPNLQRFLNANRRY